MGRFAIEITRRLQVQVHAARDAYGEAWAAAAREEVPVDTGRLKGSIRYADGALIMLRYGLAVNDGHRIVTRHGPTFVIDAQGRVTKTVRRVPPNPFLARARASAQVQDVVRRFPHLLFRS